LGDRNKFFHNSVQLAGNFHQLADHQDKTDDRHQLQGFEAGQTCRKAVEDTFWGQIHPKTHSQRPNEEAEAKVKPQPVQPQHKSEAAENFDQGWDMHQNRIYHN